MKITMAFDMTVLLRRLLWRALSLRSFPVPTTRASSRHQAPSVTKQCAALTDHRIAHAVRSAPMTQVAGEDACSFHRQTSCARSRGLHSSFDLVGRELD